MSNIFIISYSPGSNSAKLLAQKLGAKRIRHVNSKFKGGSNKYVVHWGLTSYPSDYLESQIERSRHINNTILCRRSSDKIDSLSFLTNNGIPCIEYTTDMSRARAWLLEGRKVVIRNLTRGSGGRGIEIVEDEDALYRAPLYTKYFPKKKEFRVHVSNRGLFYVQRKVIRRDVLEELGPENINWQIRNLENGFVFQRHDIEVPDAVVDLAERLKDVIGNWVCPRFVICADVLYNERLDQAVICELNSAPGLDDTSAEIYANEIRAIIEEDE